MISAMSNLASRYLHAASRATSVPAVSPADAQSGGAESTDADTSKFRISVSQVKALQGARFISAADDPVLHDLMAANWLRTHAAGTTQPAVSDDAPQNTYAQVKVDGRVVATLYNGGSATISTDVAAKIGDVKDPPGLAGPNLAQWRADTYATLLGGKVEKAPTALMQSQWTPRSDTADNYSREQLDAAFEAMLTEGRNAAAQREAAYARSQSPAGASANLTA